MSGGSNGILNTNIFPNGNNFNINLIVTDTNGYFDNDNQIFNSTTPNYVALDTSGTNFNSQTNSFSYCENDSTITDTLFNIFSNTSGIDTVIIDNGITQDVYTSVQGFDEFYINISESVYTISVTTIFSGNCQQSTISYNVLYNVQLANPSASFGTVCSPFCVGTEIPFTIDPNQFDFPLNAELIFTVECTDSSSSTSLVWDRSQYL